MSDLILDKAKISGHLRKLVSAINKSMERMDDEANNHDLLNLVASSLNEEIKRSSLDLGQLITVIQVKAKEAEAEAKAKAEWCRRLAEARAEIDAAETDTDKADAKEKLSALLKSISTAYPNGFVEPVVTVGHVDEGHRMQSVDLAAKARELSGFVRQPWHRDGAFMDEHGVVHYV